jgi:hypothetical protein
MLAGLVAFCRERKVSEGYDVFEGFVLGVCMEFLSRTQELSFTSFRLFL